ncbi:hypothetical protein BD560DRAFT_491935 [Blakeslea trispora]|nr:hypothetical protein BD560DRAFT_491935 [Blakeslea trispora]
MYDSKRKDMTFYNNNIHFVKLPTDTSKKTELLLQEESTPPLPLAVCTGGCGTKGPLDDNVLFLQHGHISCKDTSIKHPFVEELMRGHTELLLESAKKPNSTSRLILPTKTMYFNQDKSRHIEMSFNDNRITIILKLFHTGKLIYDERTQDKKDQAVCK